MGLGAILSQDVGGEEHPILYNSQTLFPCELSYVIKKEALVLKGVVDTLCVGESFPLSNRPCSPLLTQLDERY